MDARSLGTPVHSGIGSAAPAPKRRAGGLQQAAPAAGSASEPWPSLQRQHLLAGGEQGWPSPRAGWRRPKRGQAMLAGAEDLSLPPQAEVDLGELEAVALAGHRLPAARRASPPASAGEQQALGGVLAAANPARASWCSWETPKRSAPSITITVALATSIPTSITVRRHQHLGFPPPRTARIASALSAEDNLTVEDADPESRAARPRASRSASTSAALPWDFVGLLDQRGRRRRPWRPLAPAARARKS